MLKVGGYSPWGSIQDITNHAPGIDFVGTAGHGGFKLDRSRNAQVPKPLRSPGGWYEEDCEWAIVVITFPQFFDSVVIENAHATVVNGSPDEYEQVFNCSILPGESLERSRKEFTTKHANDWVVVSAWGSTPAQWPQDRQLPPGKVYVLATLGGNRGSINGRGETRTFYVDEDEYQKRSRFGFVIDLERHEPAPPLYETV